ncbi:hypothetical protein ACFQ2Y_29980 [Streptomyces malaysiensis subsp. malaysiensis]
MNSGVCRAIGVDLRGVVAVTEIDVEVIGVVGVLRDFDRALGDGVIARGGVDALVPVRRLRIDGDVTVVAEGEDVIGLEFPTADDLFGDRQVVLLSRGGLVPELAVLMDEGARGRRGRLGCGRRECGSPRASARVAVAAMVRYMRIGVLPFVRSVPIGPVEKRGFSHRVPAIGELVFPIAPVDRDS